MKIKSVITASIQDIYQATTVTEARQKLIGLLEQSRIKQVDKVKMIETATKLNNLNAIYRYATNAMFKYEGLGVA